jgi:hypothetical protein
MLGVGRFGAILGTFMEAFCSVWAGGFQLIMGVLAVPAAVAAIAVPLKDPQVSNVGPARHGRTGHREG